MHKAINAWVTSFQIKTFRCFENFTLHMNAPIVLLQGQNGGGKTSILEALHYACYLKSFRTSTPKDLISHEKDAFFIQVNIKNGEQVDEISVGFSGAKRLVKVNKKTISSYKELMSHYRVVTVTEEDLNLIKEGPSVRRSFMDQALLLLNPDYIHDLRKVRAIIEKRNMLFQNGAPSREMYMLWTQQLWEKSHIIKKARIEFLEQLQQKIDSIIKQYSPELPDIVCKYVSKRISINSTFEQFQEKIDNFYTEEVRFRRSLFGSHIDDMTISFAGKRSRLYASRGQQKLAVLLIKIAQIQLLPHTNATTILLLDDFMTDLDDAKSHLLFQILSNLGLQLIFTTPASGGSFKELLKASGAQICDLSSL